MSSAMPPMCGSELAHLDARLAVRLKLVLRAEQGRIRIDEGGAVALEQVGRGQLAVVLGELGLRVEKLEVARGPGLEHVDHPLRLRGVVRRLTARAARRGAMRGDRLVAPAANRRRCRRGPCRSRRKTSGGEQSRARASCDVASSMVMSVRASGQLRVRSTSVFGQRFVEVEEHPRHERPRGGVLRRRAAGRAGSFSASPVATSRGFEPAVGDRFRWALRGRRAAPRVHRPSAAASVQSKKAYRPRLASSAPPSRSVRRARARAASTKTGSLSPASAASGVFDRSRRAQESRRSGRRSCRAPGRASTACRKR